MDVRQIAENMVSSFSQEKKLDLAFYDSNFQEIAKSDGFFEEKNSQLKELIEKKQIISDEYLYSQLNSTQGDKLYFCIKAKLDEAKQTLKQIETTFSCIDKSLNSEEGKENFYKNILNSNVYGFEIDQIARKIYLPVFNKRTVLFIHFENAEKNMHLIEKCIKRFIASNNKKAVCIQINVDSFAIIIENVESEDEVKDFSKALYSILKRDFENECFLSYGGISTALRNLLKSYKEAYLAFDAGVTFAKEQKVYSYNNLGLSRLIFQTPIELCKLFLDEAFKNNKSFVIDEELEQEINVFFQYNLNISETARALDIHRNTLVYRLDKLKQETGLDIRNFNDAIIFYIAIMILKYIRKKEKNKTQ